MTPIIELDELALLLSNGDKVPSGCSQVFAPGHCSSHCADALLQDWRRLKAQRPARSKSM